MNELLNLFSNFTITEEYPNRGWLSEIFGPSKVWLQVEDPELLRLCDDIDDYYNVNHESKFLEINENDLKVGMKIAAYVCGKWNRATILSNRTPKGNICIFADDFGTKGYLNLKYCRILADDFQNIPRKSIRACLSGIAPLDNAKLYDIDATNFIIKFCYNRLFRFKFVRHHAKEDFYEIIACRDDGEILNDNLVKSGLAKPIEENPKFDIFYPAFDLLEKSQFYETYSHRYIYRKKGINFNAFEEEFINPHSPYEEQLFSLLACDKFQAIRKVFEMLRV
ncbi:uncharacterized protein [Chironomus tepperi]|uniref:uncharacterized protein n=1 Tax=Chironomus tepperi TaxID=113505 RepID=UPI00391F7F7B